MMLLLPFFVGLGAFWVFRYFWARRVPGAKRDLPAVELLTFDAWAFDIIGRALGKKTSLGDQIFATLTGTPEAHVVSVIEAEVHRVEIEFVKYTHESDAEVTLHLHFEDGTKVSERCTRTATSLPQSVQDEFERKGATRAFRTWSLPWARRH
jgi:hypothetical protein